MRTFPAQKESEDIYTGFLDLAHALPLTVRFNDGQTTITLHLGALQNEGFKKHLSRHLTLMADNQPVTLERQHDQLSATPCVRNQLSFQLNRKEIASLLVSGKTVQPCDNTPYTRLTVFETRMLGRYPHSATLPYDRHTLQALHTLPTPRTDLHTHLSSQIQAADLFEVAVRMNASYPVALLNILDIDTSRYPSHPMDSYEFIPTQSEGLACEQRGQRVDGLKLGNLASSDRHRFIRAMSVPVDSIYTFEQLEKRVYRLRNPLTKNPEVVAEIVQKVAEDYHHQGIEYAELAVTGALKPDWLAMVIPALETAEQTFGTKLRLLAAIPRTLPPQQMLQRIEMAKFAAQSPYVVGVDFVGYESNKTENFTWAIRNIASWAKRQKEGHGDPSQGWTFADDFIIRVHAGENGKNMNNIRAVLEIARDYGVRTRIGHGIYTHKSRTLDLAKALQAQSKLILEFNPDSNMALNNIDNAAQIPIKDWIDQGIPAVIASDGAGAYQTNAKQLAMVGIFAGLDEADLQQIRRWEKEHISRQDQLFEEKSRAFRTKYTSLHAFIEGFRTHQHTITRPEPERLMPKVPILIAGASGASWERMADEEQRQFNIGMDMLVEILDPEKVYFAMGRVKNAGIGQALDIAVTHYNERHSNSTPFDVVGVLYNQQNMPSVANCLSYIIPVSGQLMGIPGEMVQFVKTRNGHAIYAGGSDFTRDFILLSEQEQIPFGVMKDATGASQDAALAMEAAGEEYSQPVFEGAIGMVEQLARQPNGRALFKPGISLERQAIEALYETIAHPDQNGTPS